MSREVTLTSTISPSTNPALLAANAQFRWAKPLRWRRWPTVRYSRAEGDTLASIAATSPVATTDNARFRVIDRGLGRVALQAMDGRYASASAGGVTWKPVESSNLTDAETFQWVNLLRGHTMLMSLANHQYLHVKPQLPGPATASAIGPRPIASVAAVSRGRSWIDRVAQQKDIRNRLGFLMPMSCLLECCKPSGARSTQTLSMHSRLHRQNSTRLTQHIRAAHIIRFLTKSSAASCAGPCTFPVRIIYPELHPF